MAKLRLQFEKNGTARYISHLDLMRTFQRLFLRAGIFLKHSKGFHPHPMISIVLPLPVGQSSACELLNFEIDTPVDTETLPAALNTGCPDGLRILRAYEAVRPVKELSFVQVQMKLLYDNGAAEDTVQRLKELFSRPNLILPKKTKRKELAEVDIIPLIRSLTFRAGAEGIEADAVVSAQNPGLNPSLIVTAVERELPGYAPDFAAIHRVKMLDASGGEFL